MHRADRIDDAEPNIDQIRTVWYRFLFTYTVIRINSKAPIYKYIVSGHKTDQYAC